MKKNKFKTVDQIHNPVTIKPALIVMGGYMLLLVLHGLACHFGLINY